MSQQQTHLKSVYFQGFSRLFFHETFQRIYLLRFPERDSIFKLFMRSGSFKNLSSLVTKRLLIMSQKKMTRQNCISCYQSFVFLKETSFLKAFWRRVSHSQNQKQLILGWYFQVIFSIFSPNMRILHYHRWQSMAIYLN